MHQLCEGGSERFEITRHVSALRKAMPELLKLVSIALLPPYSVFGRTAPCIAINCLRVIATSTARTKPADGPCSSADHESAPSAGRTGSRVSALLSDLGNVAGPRGDVPLQIFEVHATWGSPMARVGPDMFFLAAQQVGAFIPKCHWLPFFGLVHPEIALTFGILRRTGRGDDPAPRLSNSHLRA